MRETGRVLTPISVLSSSASVLLSSCWSRIPVQQPVPSRPFMSSVDKQRWVLHLSWRSKSMNRCIFRCKGLVGYLAFGRAREDLETPEETRNDWFEWSAQAAKTWSDEHGWKIFFEGHWTKTSTIELRESKMVYLSVSTNSNEEFLRKRRRRNWVLVYSIL